MQISNIITYFPEEIFETLNGYFMENKEEKEKNIEEIRLRAEKPLVLKFNKKEVLLKVIVTQEMILKVLQKVCDNSIYSYQNQIKDGFITIKGGHRIGVSGNCVVEKNQISNISYVSSLNFRIAKEIKGCSNRLLKYVLDTENNSIYTTLIVSPPGVRENNYFKRFNKKNKQWNRKAKF